jgi:hypothetical protein
MGGFGEDAHMPSIVLATQNAKWIHASFGLRCLRANLGELRERSVIVERDLAAARRLSSRRSSRRIRASSV